MRAIDDDTQPVETPTARKALLDGAHARGYIGVKIGSTSSPSAQLPR